MNKIFVYFLLCFTLLFNSQLLGSSDNYIELKLKITTADWTNLIKGAHKIVSNNPEEPIGNFLLSVGYFFKSALTEKEKAYKEAFRTKSNHSIILDWTRKLTQEYPKNSWVWIIHGLTYSTTDRTDIQKECYLKAKALNPELKITEEIFQLYSMGGYGKDIKLYKKAVEIAPEDFESLYNLGCAYLKQNLLYEAEECFLKAIKLKADFAACYSNLGLINLEKGLISEATYYFNKALYYDDKNHVSYYNLGLIAYRNKEFSNARNYFLKCIELELDDYETYNNLGLIYKYDKDINSAVKLYEKIIDLNPEFTEAYINLGNLYQLQKDYLSAIKMYEKAIKLNPADPLPYYNLGLIYFEQKQYEKSIANYNQAIKLNREFTEAYINLAAVYHSIGDDKQAVTIYKKSIELTKPAKQKTLAKTDVKSLYSRASQFYASGNYKEAVKLLQEIVKYNPYYKDAQRYLDKTTAILEFIEK